MQTKFQRTLVVLGSAAALAAPAAAVAKKGGKSERPDRAAAKGPKFKTVNLKGDVVSADGSPTVTVLVKKGNKRGRAYANQTLQLDLTAARVTVEDVNGDGASDVRDIADGDRFVAQVRVPRGSVLDTTAAIETRRFVDQGPPEVEEDDDAEEQDTEEG